MQVLMVIKHHQTLFSTSRPLIYLTRTLTGGKTTLNQYFRRTFISLGGIPSSKSVKKIWRAKWDSIRMRVNLFHSSRPRQQDPFKKSNEQQSSGEQNNQDQRRNALIILISLGMTMLAYTKIQQAQAEINARNQEAQALKNDVIYDYFF